jgi:peptide/nickel transport system substrate-binding protein
LRKLVSMKRFLSHLTTVGLGILLPVAALAGAAWCTSAPPLAGAEGTNPPLIGQVEGPEVITDASSYPTTLREAPMLAELVAAGKLPPLEQRLPVREDLLVLQPLEAIGKYGGTLRRGFTGPADAENGNRINAAERLLFTDYTGTQTRPSVAKAITVNGDGTVFTLELRRGLRWSDGHPFTAEDIVWWYENVWLNREILPTVVAEMTIGGKQGRIERVDDYTVRYVFPAPYFLFEEILRGDTWIGGGPARYGSGTSMFGTGGYAPAHYVKQFHPGFAPKEKIDAAMRAGGYNSWVELYLAKNNWSLNPDKPVLGPWRTVSPINSARWVLERNPYFYQVDTAGNQLPYIDRIEMTLAEDLEVLNMRAIAGEYDFQSRHIKVDKLPVLLKARHAGNFRVHVNTGVTGGAACVFFNLAYDGDPEIQKWQSTADFRRALSLALDRGQINEVFYLGLGRPGSHAVAEEHPHNPGPEWRTRWSTYDPDRARKMLDAIGLDKKDSRGFRLRTDNGQRLRLEILTWDYQNQDYTGMAEMVARDWAAVGVYADIVEVERTHGQTRQLANANQIELTEAPGTDTIWSHPQNVLPINFQSRLGVPFSRWYATSGRTGVKPRDPQILRAYELFRSAPGRPEAERTEIARELWRIHVDQQWVLALTGMAPAAYGVHVASNNLGNVPERMSMVRDARVPGGAHPQMFFFGNR